VPQMYLTFVETLSPEQARHDGRRIMNVRVMPWKASDVSFLNLDTAQPQDPSRGDAASPLPSRGAIFLELFERASVEIMAVTPITPFPVMIQTPNFVSCIAQDLGR
jgi:hypothetical protein